jgi:hypothetical protein
MVMLDLAVLILTLEGRSRHGNAFTCGYGIQFTTLFEEDTAKFRLTLFSWQPKSPLRSQTQLPRQN